MNVVGCLVLYIFLSISLGSLAYALLLAISLKDPSF